MRIVWIDPNFFLSLSKLHPNRRCSAILPNKWRSTGQWFQHKKGAPLVPWYVCTPKTVKFGLKLAFLAHLIQCPTKKQCKQVAKVVFRYVGNGQISAFLAHLIPCLPKKTMQTRWVDPFWVLFGPKYAFIGPYRPCWFIWCTGGRGWWLWRGLYLARHLCTL